MDHPNHSVYGSTEVGLVAFANMMRQRIADLRGVLEVARVAELELLEEDEEEELLELLSRVDRAVKLSLFGDP